jgi:ABC-type transport system involved in cytochrome c biogenesis permease subunit
MLAQFLVTLTRFLGRTESAATTAAARKTATDKKSSADATGSGTAGWLRPTVLVPVAVVLLFAGYVVRKSAMPVLDADVMNLDEFGKLPLVYEGRVKPMDTLARTTLRALSGRETFVDKDGKSQPAIRWLLDVMARGDVAEGHAIFREENLEVLDLLGLERRKGFRYALGEFRAKVEQFETEVKKAKEVDPRDLSASQKKMLALDRQISLYLKLDGSIHPRVMPQLPSEDELKNDPDGARQRFRMSIERSRDAMEQLKRMEPPLIVPGGSPQTPWLPYSNALIEAYLERIIGQQVSNPAILSLAGIFEAYGSDKAEAFNSAVSNYREFLIKHPPQYSDVEKSGLESIYEWGLVNLLGFDDSPFLKSDFEAWFNHADLFNLSAYGYLTAFLLTCISWLAWPRTLSRSALALILFTFVVHTLALAARVYISGRPPVTNLYSASVFIGWGTVVLGMIYECVYRIGIGTIVASVAGYASMIVAAALIDTNPGDTFTVLQAVLDTQFWLATHVTCITLGYATTYVAGLLGLIYVLRGVLTTTLTPDVGKDLARMTYGTLCFAIFFSFVGTVLGGLWADDSWGRFWGWDPKENGALMIVLWNAVVLHARWGGLVRDRGMCVLAIVGNIVTSWSFFGVNELGFGLHSYGRTEGVLEMLALFCFSQLLLIALGSLPRDKWRSAAAG